MNIGMMAMMAASMGLAPWGRTFRARYDPAEQAKNEEEDRRRAEKRASRATYHQRLMEKQRAEIARIEAMRAADERSKG